MNMRVRIVRSDGVVGEYPWVPLPRAGVMTNLLGYLNRLMEEHPVLHDDVEMTASILHDLSPQPWMELKMKGSRGWIWREDR